MKRMSAQYAAAKKSRINITEFRGVDLCNSPTNVSPTRSPSAPNMIRDVPGKVRKRMGYYKVASYGSRINGVFNFTKGAETHGLVHAGEQLYRDETLLYTGMRDERSTGWQLGQTLFLCDGKQLLAYDGDTVQPVSADAYVPKYIIARKPSGGGKVYEALNLIGDKWTESFLSDGAAVVYQLAFDALDDSYVKVERMTAADVWNELTKTTDYTFNAALGRVTFVTKPPVSPSDGVDNIRITVQKTRTDYADRINHCTLSVLYGVAGAADRLFLTGNPEYPNYDWYSEMNEGRYFPQTDYCVLGLNSPITGYSIIANKLAAHKSSDAGGASVGQCGRSIRGRYNGEQHDLSVERQHAGLGQYRPAARADRPAGQAGRGRCAGAGGFHRDRRGIGRHRGVGHQCRHRFGGCAEFCAAAWCGRQSGRARCNRFTRAAGCGR